MNSMSSHTANVKILELDCSAGIWCEVAIAKEKHTSQEDQHPLPICCQANIFGAFVFLGMLWHASNVGPDNFVGEYKFVMLGMLTCCERWQCLCMDGNLDTVDIQTTTSGKFPHNFVVCFEHV